MTFVARTTCVDLRRQTHHSTRGNTRQDLRTRNLAEVGPLPDCRVIIRGENGWYQLSKRLSRGRARSPSRRFVWHSSTLRAAGRVRARVEGVTKYSGRGSVVRAMELGNARVSYADRVSDTRHSSASAHPPGSILPVSLRPTFTPQHACLLPAVHPSGTRRACCAAEDTWQRTRGKLSHARSGALPRISK